MSTDTEKNLEQERNAYERSIDTIYNLKDASDSNPVGSTKERVLKIATTLFAADGYEATSLDEMADELDMTKQTILYHFGSKADLLKAVIDSSLDKLTNVFENPANYQKGVEGVVKAVFSMATQNPEVLGILREVIRLGGQWQQLVRKRLQPYIESAQAYLQAEMDARRIKSANPQFILLAAYSTVIGVATDFEFLRAMGIKTSLKEAAVRRKELLNFLSSAIGSS